MNKLIIVLISMILMSCKTDDTQKITSKIAEIWDADKCFVESTNASEKTITLVIENPKNIKDDFPNENITSMASFTFINESLPQDYKNINDIKVILKRKPIDFEKTYKVSDLINAKGYFEIIDSLSSKMICGNLKGFESYFDNTIITDSTILNIKNWLTDLKNSNGKYEKLSIIYFDFNALEKNNEPVFVSNFILSNKNVYTDFKAILRQEDKKIIFIGLN